MFRRASVEPPPDVAVPPRALGVLRWPLVSMMGARSLASHRREVDGASHERAGVHLEQTLRAVDHGFADGVIHNLGVIAEQL